MYVKHPQGSKIVALDICGHTNLCICQHRQGDNIEKNILVRTDSRDEIFFCVFLSLPDDSDGDIEAPISGQNKWMDGLIREERARNLNGELDSDMEFFVHDYCS